jgi:hypothetical protein
MEVRYNDFKFKINDNGRIFREAATYRNEKWVRSSVTVEEILTAYTRIKMLAGKTLKAAKAREDKLAELKAQEKHLYASSVVDFLTAIGYTLNLIKR